MLCGLLGDSEENKKSIKTYYYLNEPSRNILLLVEWGTATDYLARSFFYFGWSPGFTGMIGSLGTVQLRLTMT
jgi:uncharacterized membrane protein